MDRETLKQKIADAIRQTKSDFYSNKSDIAPTNCGVANAVLSAISEAGCVIAPKEPTLTQIKTGARTIRQQNQYGGGSEFADSRAAYVAMLSASPFRLDGE